MQKKKCVREDEFQSELIKELKSILPQDDCMILKNDPNYIQGVPDLSIFYKNKWATLECKRSQDASFRPNQEYYIGKMNNMSFSRAIYPENKKEVVSDLLNFLKED